MSKTARAAQNKPEPEKQTGDEVFIVTSSLIDGKQYDTEDEAIEAAQAEANKEHNGAREVVVLFGKRVVKSGDEQVTDKAKTEAEEEDEDEDEE